MRAHRNATRGFSILEVMISLIVVSLGLGGILFAQSRALSSANGAGQRNMATQLAEHILDRARANPDEAYTVAFDETPSADGTVAERDLNVWKRKLSEALRDGDGWIVSESAATNTTSAPNTIERLTVKIRWREQQFGAGNSGTTQARTSTAEYATFALQGFRAKK